MFTQMLFEAILWQAILRGHYKLQQPSGLLAPETREGGHKLRLVQCAGNDEQNHAKTTRSTSDDIS